MRHCRAGQPEECGQVGGSPPRPVAQVFEPCGAGQLRQHRDQKQGYQRIALAAGFALIHQRRQIDETPERFHKVLKKIATTIRDGLLTFAGGGSPIFAFEPGLRRPRTCAEREQAFGWVAMPEAVWLALSRFEHWIEDSIVVRWAALTAEMNCDDPQSLSRTLPLLLSRPAAERATGEMRGWLSPLPQPVECVWSGRSLAQAFDVDHANSLGQ